MAREARKITSSSVNKSVMEVRFAQGEAATRPQPPDNPGRGIASALKGLQAGGSL